MLAKIDMLGDIAEARTVLGEPLIPVYDIVEINMQRDDGSTVQLSKPTVAYSHNEKMIFFKSKNICEFYQQGEEEI